MQYPEGWTMYASEAVKKAVTIPVINSHSLRNPEYCERMLAEGKTDMIGLSRQLLADPYWQARIEAREGQGDPQVHLLPHGLLAGIHDGKKGNRLRDQPGVQDGDENPRMTRAEKPMKVAVVGGGPAGMEAARVATERGHKVTLFEKTAELGGAILGCCVASRGRTRR